MKAADGYRYDAKGDFESMWAMECPACGRTVQGVGEADPFKAHDCRVKPLIDRIVKLEDQVAYLTGLTATSRTDEAST